MISTVMDKTPDGLFVYVENKLYKGIEFSKDELIETFTFSEVKDLSRCIDTLHAYKIQMNRIYIVASWIQKEYPNNSIDWKATFEHINRFDLQNKLAEEYDRGKRPVESDWAAYMRAIDIGNQMRKLEEHVLAEVAKNLKKYNLI